MNEQVSKKALEREAAYAQPLETLNPAQPALFEADAVLPYFERLRAEDPVHYTPESDYGPYWSITKYNDIMAVDTNHQVFSSDYMKGGITISGGQENFEPLPMFIAMDPPKHDDQRKVVSPIVAPANLAKLESTIRERAGKLRPLLDAFTPAALREWIHGLGIDTFVGSSGRVFPTDMKAAPLLRAWLKRLRENGVHIHTRQRWLGWDEHGALRIAGPQGESLIDAHATLLALGGGSWARLGSDGAWVPLLAARGIAIEPLQPANCGFQVEGWSTHLRDKFAGAPLKTVSLALPGSAPRKGEFVLTATGIEGSLVYALSAPIREAINRDGGATVLLDLLPDRTLAQVASALARPRGS